MKPVDITGQRYGRLVAIKCVGSDKHHHAMWKCKCDCGNIATVASNSLKRGLTKSCGCLSNEYLHSAKKGSLIHEKTGSRLYAVWCGMKQRCYDKNSDHYYRYGGRGITVCDEWLYSFSAFEKWALENGYDEFAKQGECTIDRIDNDGNYCPENCRFVSMKVQYYNRNVPKSMTEIAKEHGLTYDAVHQRIKKGMTLEKALKKPLRKNVFFTFNGQTKTMSEWARETGIPIPTLRYRKMHGWPDEKALSPKGGSYLSEI